MCEIILAISIGVVIISPFVIVGGLFMYLEDKNTSYRQSFDIVKWYRKRKFDKMVNKLRYETIKYELFGEDD